MRRPSKEWRRPGWYREDEPDQQAAGGAQMDTGQYEVRFAGTVDYIDRSAALSSRTPVTCRECNARTGLTLTARGEETAIICEAGHTTTDWRLTREAVQAVAARAAEAGVDVVPANAEVWVKVRTETGILPEYEDIA
jgi:hypothetical protein